MGPAKVFWICRIDFSRPVVAKAHGLDLAPKITDIFRRGNTRVSSGLNRVLLRRQAKGVPAHRMKDIVSKHTAVPTKNIGRSVSFEVTDVEARS